MLEGQIDGLPAGHYEQPVQVRGSPRSGGIQRGVLPAVDDEQLVHHQVSGYNLLVEDGKIDVLQVGDEINLSSRSQEQAMK